ncbi:hypothetical protein AB0953_22760 [Streptomyces sp. NPDC046866]|uniref:hypothetical protein n=1 Tax=Streptomyces sp. NPDC046866 TaxID=3154921 RepID=UPI003452F32C
MTSDAAHGPAAAAEDLHTSAKGWHGIQLAVLGFIGLCGVLKGSGPAGVPRTVQVVAGLLALSSLATACCAIFLVGLAAWPLYRGGVRPADPGRTGRALRTGIALTFTAVALLALSAGASWWPTPEKKKEGAARSLVRVSTEAGTVCGSLGESDYGRVALRTADRTVTLALGEITALQPVSSCG